MTARRGLTEGEAFESDSSQAIYRPVRHAARGLDSDDTAPINMTRAARRFLTDDTTTIRPGFKAGVAASVETTIIRIKHASSTPQRRRISLAAIVVPVLGVATIAGFGILGPQTSNTSQPPVAMAFAQNPAPVAKVAPAGDAVDYPASLLPADASAADALATDAQVKAEAEAAAKAAAAAAAAAEAAAKARAGLYGDYMATDGGGDPVPVEDGAFIWPVSGFSLTSTFGWRSSPFHRGSEFHTGLDLALPCGQPIYASAGGVVTFADWMGGFGNYTAINSGPVSIGYGHQSQIVVAPGQTVAQGELVGYVGSTGASTGCHVHFQAINQAQHKYFDPMTLIH